MKLSDRWGKLRVAADVGQSGALLEFRQFGFCGAQFVVV